MDVKHLKGYKIFESVNEVIDYLGFNPELLDDYMVPFEDMDCFITLKLSGRIPQGVDYDDCVVEYDYDYDDNSDEVILYEYGEGVQDWRLNCPFRLNDIEDLENLEFYCFLENNDGDTEEFKEEVSNFIDKLNDIFEYVTGETNDENCMTLWFKDYKNKK